MKRKLLGGALVIAACCAIFGAAGYTRTTVVQAQGCSKTVDGKQTATESGTLVCDCTIKATTCGCVVTVPCPPGGGDGGFETESGGAQ